VLRGQINLLAGTYASPVVNRTYTLINGETVQILGVPEPSHLVLMAGIGAALGFRRLRKGKKVTATKSG